MLSRLYSYKIRFEYEGEDRIRLRFSSLPKSITFFSRKKLKRFVELYSYFKYFKSTIEYIPKYNKQKLSDIIIRVSMLCCWIYILLLSIYNYPTENPLDILYQLNILLKHFTKEVEIVDTFFIKTEKVYK